MIRRLLLVLCSAVLAFGMVELWLRWFPPSDFARHRDFRYLFQPDPLIRFTMRPNLKCTIGSEAGGTFPVETNSYGLRDRHYNGKEGRENILGIGDSFLFADGVEYEEGMLSLLSEMLEKDLPGKYRTINAGVPKYSANQEILYYFEKGDMDFDPKAVLLFFYMNDVVFDVSVKKEELRFHRGIPVPEMIIKDDFSVDTIWTDPSGHGRFKIDDYLRFLWEFQWETRKVERPGQKLNKLYIEAGLLHKREFPHQKYRFTNLWAVLKHLKKQTWLNGAKLMIVYVPAAREVEEGVARQMYYDQYNCPRSDWDWNLCMKEMEWIVKDADIPFVNLAPAFQEHWEKTGRSLYFKGFGHFTPEGHRLAARTILPDLGKVLAAAEREEFPSGKMDIAFVDYSQKEEELAVFYRIAPGMFSERKFNLSGPMKKIRFYLHPSSDPVLVGLNGMSYPPISPTSERLRLVEIPLEGLSARSASLSIRPSAPAGNGAVLTEPTAVE